MAEEIKLSGKEFQELKCIRLSLQDIATELRKMNRKDERYQEIWNEGYLAGIKSMQPQVYPNDPPYRTSTYYEKLRRESEELKRRIEENRAANITIGDLSEFVVDPNSPERM